MTRPLSLGQEIEISIDRLAYHSGHGVGRYQGMVVFVPFTAPGDHILARVVELHSSYAVADLLKIEVESPARRTAPCSVAGTCGGCKWQHVTYQEQVKQKQEQLVSALHRLNKSHSLPILPMIPAPAEFHYRNRIQIHRHGEKLGFYASGSHRLVEINECLLAEQEINSALETVRTRHLKPHAPDKERVEIARLQNGELDIRPASQQDGGDGRFAQVNEAQNSVLISVLVKAIKAIPFASAVDLYCGSGNLTFPLAEKLPSTPLLGVEASPYLVDLAKRRQGSQSLFQNIEWAAQTCATFLRSWKRPPGPLLVVLDPPRPGCDRETRQAIGKLRPQQIIYISCNPTTLARDLEPWLNSDAYEVEFIQGLDMFPQTAHLEAIASLQLKNSL